MNRHEQIDAFRIELGSLVSRFRAEFDLDLHTIIGVIEDEKMELLLGGVGFDSDIDLDDDSEEET